MEAHITVNSLKITSKAKESIIGPMDVNTMVNGKIIRWKAMVFSRGLMADAMKVPTSTIRKKVMETSTGPMDVNTKVAGRMVNNMVLVPTPPQAGKLNRANGQ